MPSDKPDMSIVIPCYNEEKNIEEIVVETVRSMERHKIAYELILVDNGSSDSTGDIISRLTRKNKNIKKIKIEKNVGYGYGIRLGLKKSMAPIVGWIDADNQVNPRYIAEFYRKMKEKDYDMVAAKRIKRHDGLRRKIESFLYNHMMHILFKTVMDINGKPKIFKKACYDHARIESDNWSIDTEIVIKFSKAGFNILQMPVISSKRKSGSSNVKFYVYFELLKGMLRYR